MKKRNSCYCVQENIDLKLLDQQEQFRKTGYIELNNSWSVLYRWKLSSRNLYAFIIPNQEKL
jgi:hypothetical protein